MGQRGGRAARGVFGLESTGMWRWCAGLLLALAAPFAAADDDGARYRAAVAAGQDYLYGALLPDGRFLYSVRESSAHVSDDYNVLRHAGTVWTMATTGNLDDDRRGRLGVAIDYLRHCCLAPPEEGADTLAVWSEPAIVGGGRRKAKLGGAGLYLSALLAVQGTEPAALDEARAVGRFIRFMQREDGSFVSRYIPESGGFDEDWVSLYYPGEAALALVSLESADPDGGWREAAVAALDRLARDRAGQRRVPADHWALLATGALWAQSSPEGDLAERLYGHVQQVVGHILTERTAAEGPLTEDGRSAPTATRIEALVAAYPILLARDPALADRVRRRAQSAADWLLTCQIADGPLAGGVRRCGGGKADEVRIDYVQHAISAWAGMAALAPQRGSPPTPDAAPAPPG